MVKSIVMRRLARSWGYSRESFLFLIMYVMNWYLDSKIKEGKDDFDC